MEYDTGMLAHTYLWLMLICSLFWSSDTNNLTLDPNTADTRLILSEENRNMTHVFEDQPYPDHPERSDECCQVLCREILTECCYWIADWSQWMNISYMLLCTMHNNTITLPHCLMYLANILCWMVYYFVYLYIGNYVTVPYELYV